jgi:Nucleotide-diphospho-sugar transferase
MIASTCTLLHMLVGNYKDIFSAAMPYANSFHRKGFLILCVSILLTFLTLDFADDIVKKLSIDLQGQDSIFDKAVLEIQVDRRTANQTRQIFSRIVDSHIGNSKPLIVIVACIKSGKSWKTVKDSSVYSIFLPSIKRTITEEEKKTFRIEVLLAFDQGDSFWESGKNRKDLLVDFPFAINFVSVFKQRLHHIPFNSACRAAFEHGADYIVRVNDDSEFLTKGWIIKGVVALSLNDPPNIGVVGPKCNEGNVAILTHDMVHRSHLEIFNYYYPDEFDNWWTDDWITKVYGAPLTKMILSWVMKHHINKHGTRYNTNPSQAKMLDELVHRGRERIRDYLSTSVRDEITPALGSSRITFVEGPIKQTFHNISGGQRRNGTDEEKYTVSHAIQLVTLAKEVKKNNPYGPYVLIQLLDKGFLTLTKHWICNVRRFPSVLSSAIFIATDVTAFEELKKFDQSLNVVHFPFSRSKFQRVLSYGQAAYYELMSFRTMILRGLLRNGISFMLLEGDSFWNSNALEDIRKLGIDPQSFDMLAATDKADLNRLQGGFQLNQATEKSKELWAKLHEKTVAAVRRFQAAYGRDSTAYLGEMGSEQLMMETLIKTEGQKIGYKIKFLPPNIVASGQWYSDQSLRKRIPSPSVILNNWIIGNPSKIARAKRNKHWCLNDNYTECSDPRILQMNRFQATITVLTMSRAKALERLLRSLAAADYSCPEKDCIDDIRLVIRVDRPKVPTKDFDRVVQIAQRFRYSVFSSISVDIQDSHQGLRSQWFTSFQQPRSWDEIGIFLEDDLELSPQYFRFLRLQWQYHRYNPLVGSISLQRQTLRATAPYKNDLSSTIVNENRPFLYRLIGTWGLSAKASTWIDFTSTYRNKSDIEIKGLQTTIWYESLKSTMWSQHFIHYLWKENKFTLFVNLPKGVTLCGNWREPGQHYDSKPSLDFPVAKTWIESSMGVLEPTPKTFGFNTLQERVILTNVVI